MRIYICYFLFENSIQFFLLNKQTIKQKEKKNEENFLKEYVIVPWKRLEKKSHI